MNRVQVFVDGFNLYYGLYKGDAANGEHCCPPNHKWLNPILLAQAICKQIGLTSSVVGGHYCTAPSRTGRNDPDQATRQQHLIRALRGLPGVNVHLGQHIEKPKKVKYQGRIVTATVREEKGSDVNLAVFLVRGAALDEYDTAIVISNDSDLENALRVSRDDFGKHIVAVSPQINSPTSKKPRITYLLESASSRSLVLDHSLLSRCLFTDPTLDDHGNNVYCPVEWK